MVIQMGLTRGLAAASQFASLTQPDDFVAGASPFRPKRFAQSNRYILPIRLPSFITGVSPQTPFPKMPKASKKKTTHSKAHTKAVIKLSAHNTERRCACRVAVRSPETKGRAPKGAQAAARNSSEPIGVY